MRPHLEFLLGTGRVNARRIDFSAQAVRRFNRHERRRYRVNAGNGGAMPSAADQVRANGIAQDAILAYAQPMSQPLAPITITGNNAAQNTTQVVIPNNVGLNTKLVIEVTGTLAPTSAAVGDTLTRTQLGLYNFFSNITLTDLNNVQRINTPSWHLALLAASRNRTPFGAAFANDSPANMGSTFAVMNGPQAVTVSQQFRIFFEVPIAYSDADLRGAIWANVTSAQWRLSMTINPNLVAPSATTDATQSAYQSASANVGVLSAVTIQVYQEYLDQIPRSGGQPMLPALSLAYNYLLTQTTLTGMTANADFPVFYPNYRTILSTIAIYDQNGTLNAGTDISYLAIQVANMNYLTKWDPFRCALQTRNMIGTDFPKGCYLLDHRRKPIDTNQYGNMSFVLNASSVAASSSLLLGYEMLAIQSQAINAGSLQGG